MRHMLDQYSRASTRPLSLAPCFAMKRPAPELPRLELEVRTLGSTSFMVGYRLESTVWDVKQSIYRLRSYPPRKQTLCIGTTVLEDHRRITHYTMTQRTVVNVVVAPPSPPRSPPPPPLDEDSDTSSDAEAHAETLRIMRALRGAR